MLVKQVHILVIFFNKFVDVLFLLAILLKHFFFYLDGNNMFIGWYNVTKAAQNTSAGRRLWTPGLLFYSELH
jgi:hypothetical protein